MSAAAAEKVLQAKGLSVTRRVEVEEKLGVQQRHRPGTAGKRVGSNIVL